jgi:hypothetical protein
MASWAAGDARSIVFEAIGGWHGASQTPTLGRVVDFVEREVRGVSRDKPNGLDRINPRECRMSIRVCLVIVVVVAVAAAAALVGSAARGANRSTSAVHWALLPGTLRSASTPRIAGTQQLTVYASNFAATSVDNAPSGTSQGDELAVTGQLRNAAGKTIGKLEAHEVLTSVTPQIIQLTATLRLRRGQLSALGTQRSTNLTRLTVAGGTRRFYNVLGGQLTATPGPHSDEKLTLQLFRR